MHNLSYSFETVPIFGHVLKMCIYFGYNPQIIFLTFYAQVELSSFLDVYYYQDMNVLRIKFSD